MKRFLQWFAHDILGWGAAPKEQSFDGCSFRGTCSYCGKRVLLDSQGNWFHIE